MSLAYRVVPDDDDHRTAYRRLLHYAFAPERGPDWDDEPREQPDEFEPRGLYERPVDEATTTATVSADGRPLAADPATVDATALVVCGGLVDFRMRVRGAWRSVGGVTAVASPPERRRRGHVGTLLDGMHDELRRRGVAFAALWPFSHPFYRRFGYGRTNDYVVHEFPPDALDAPAATPSEAGVVRRLSADDTDDVDALSALHEKSATEPLALRRSADWWRLRVFRTWTGERFVYGCEDDAGVLRSYLAYRFEEPDGADGRQLAVDYWGATDEEGVRQLLAFLRNHDSQVATVRLVAGDATLLDRVVDPGEVETRVKPGPMVRVVDVETALSGLATPAVDERVVLDVHDARHDWNDGAFEVGAVEGRTACRRVDIDTSGTGDEGGAIETVGIDAEALSRVAVGARSATALATLGRVEGTDDGVARLDALLPKATPEPYLREWF
jgi:predicted acetyltransferase